jgi:hypothetical protein
VAPACRRRVPEHGAGEAPSTAFSAALVDTTPDGSAVQVEAWPSGAQDSSTASGSSSSSAAGVGLLEAILRLRGGRGGSAVDAGSRSGRDVKSGVAHVPAGRARSSCGRGLLVPGDEKLLKRS